jgi:CHAD domain-containing protein
MARRKPSRGVVPGPEVPVGVAARAAAAGELDNLTRELAAARAGKARGVHQLRVATRRLRALLALFEDALPPRVARALAGDLAELARAAGPVRDLDVLAKAVAKRGAKVDPALELAVATILRHVRERRAAAHAALAAALDEPRVGRLTERLAALARGRGGGPPLHAVATGLVRPLVQKCLRAGRGVGDAASPAAVHRLRIRTKRARYALEALVPAGGDATRKLARRLARLQRLLGDQRDATTQRAWLADAASAFVGDAEALVAAGAVGEALRRRTKRLAKRVPAAWARVDRPKRIAAALRELERGPSPDEQAA